MTKFNEAYRTIFDVVENIKKDNLTLSPPFVFIDVRHYFFDRGQSSLQFTVIRIAFCGLLE